MSAAIPPLPNTPSWRRAQFMHRENFIFYLLLTMGAESFCGQ